MRTPIRPERTHPSWAPTTNGSSAMTTTAASSPVDTHPHRKEIARYLLSRGLSPSTADIEPDDLLIDLGKGHKIAYPDGLAPSPQPITPAPDENDALPEADVVVITWTVDEL